MTMENKKILIVEDRKDLADLLSLHLNDMGAQVTWAADGHEGLRLACARNWNAILLNIQLPEPSGLEICRKVRQNHDYVPILLLTSRSTEPDRVLGLDIGADDYITKPFSVMVLIARVKAVLRRVDTLTKPSVTTEKQPINLGAFQLTSRLAAPNSTMNPWI